MHWLCLLFTLLGVIYTSATIDNGNNVVNARPSNASKAVPINAVPVVSIHNKPGLCPEPVVLQEDPELCSSMCTGDGDCNGNTKCCFNGCGQSCLQPLDQEGESDLSVDETFIEKICDLLDSVTKIFIDFEDLRKIMKEKQLSKELGSVLEAAFKAVAEVFSLVWTTKVSLENNHAHWSCDPEGYKQLLHMVKRMSYAIEEVSALIIEVKTVNELDNCVEPLRSILEQLKKTRNEVLDCLAEFVSKAEGGLNLEVPDTDSDRVKEIKRGFNDMLPHLKDVFTKFKRLADSELYSDRSVNDQWMAMYYWLLEMTMFFHDPPKTFDQKTVTFWVKRLEERKKSVTLALANAKRAATKRFRRRRKNPLAKKIMREIRKIMTSLKRCIRSLRW